MVSQTLRLAMGLHQHTRGHTARPLPRRLLTVHARMCSTPSRYFLLLDRGWAEQGGMVAVRGGPSSLTTQPLPAFPGFETTLGFGFGPLPSWLSGVGTRHDSISAQTTNDRKSSSALTFHYAHAPYLTHLSHATASLHHRRLALPVRSPGINLHCDSHATTHARHTIMSASSLFPGSSLSPRCQELAQPSIPNFIVSMCVLPLLRPFAHRSAGVYSRTHLL